MYEPTKAATTLDREQLPVMLDTEQAAAILNVSGKHIRDLCKSKAIRAAKVGSAWRIPRDLFLKQYELV